MNLPRISWNTKTKFFSSIGKWIFFYFLLKYEARFWQRLLAQTKLPEDRKIWKENRDEVFLSQPQYKQSIDHHRERTSSLSSDQTRRVPWSVLTILAKPSSHISVIKLTYTYIIWIQIAFSRLIVGYLYERGDRK